MIFDIWTLRPDRKSWQSRGQIEAPAKPDAIGIARMMLKSVDSEFRDLVVCGPGDPFPVVQPPSGELVAATLPKAMSLSAATKLERPKKPKMKPKPKSEPSVAVETFTWPKKRPIGRVRHVDGRVRREEIEYALKQDAETLDMLSELFQA